MHEKFIPTHDKALYWTLVNFYLKEKKCYHYDSLGSNSKVTLKIIENVFFTNIIGEGERGEIFKKELIHLSPKDFLEEMCPSRLRGVVCCKKLLH